MIKLIIKIINKLKYKAAQSVYRYWILLYKRAKKLKQEFKRIVIENTESFIDKENQQKTHYFIDVNFKNLTFKMILERPGHIEDYIVKFGDWEPHISNLIAFFMKEDRVFLDVGANIGYHSLCVASSFENSECICFEPNPVIYQQLIRNIKLNNQLKNIHAYDIAVSDCDGEVEFYMQDESCFNRGISSLVYNWDLKMHDRGVSRINVKAAKLDDFLDESTKSRVSVIKIDTQGTEYQVICGFMNIIEKVRPVIFFEFETAYHPENPTEILSKIIAKISVFEYKVFLVKDRCPEIFSKFDISLISKDLSFECDFVCLPTEYLLV